MSLRRKSEWRASSLALRVRNCFFALQPAFLDESISRAKCRLRRVRGVHQPDQRPVKRNQNHQNDCLNHCQAKPDSKEVSPIEKAIRISHNENSGLINKDLAPDREGPNHAYAERI